MQFIDTHSHIYLEEFEQDRTEVIQRAIDNQVGRIIMPNIDKNSLEPMLNLCNNFPEICLPMIGIHPTSVKNDYADQLTLVEKEVKKGIYVAIGEIGIDLYWDKTHINEQIKAFEYQIEIALEYNLPIAVHARDSFAEIFNVLKKYNNTHLQGVMHSFTGNNKMALEALDLGFYIGIGGISTFKNAGIGKVIKNIPLSRMILETDSPYLAPTPYRGKRNESSYIRNIAENLAKLKNTSLKEVADATTLNAKKLFKL